MHNFKVGDIVVGNQDNKANFVVEGQLYEVLAVEIAYGFEYIKTDLNPNTRVLSERFHLYKPAPPPSRARRPAPASAPLCTLQRRHSRLPIRSQELGRECLAS